MLTVLWVFLIYNERHLNLMDIRWTLEECCACLLYYECFFIYNGGHLNLVDVKWTLKFTEVSGVSYTYAKGLNDSIFFLLLLLSLLCISLFYFRFLNPEPPWNHFWSGLKKKVKTMHSSLIPLFTNEFEYRLKI